MATEADLIQKFKDLNIPVGSDFEELIHEAFVGANLVDKVDNHDSRIATLENDLSATKGSVQAKVTDNKDGTEQLNGVKVQPFNKLSDSVGGRNLAPNTSDDWQKVSVPSGWGTANLSNKIYEIKDGETYTIQVEVRNMTSTIMLETYNFTASGARNWLLIPHAYTSDDTKIIVTFTAKLPENYAYFQPNLAFSNYLTSAGSYEYRRFKFEEGSVATDWTPAPEDKADDNKVVHTSGDEEIAGQKTFDTAPIDKTTGNPYSTKSDITTAISAATANMAEDSKVAHLSGANNFDTVPTVNNNPLLLASSLPSDLARTSQQTNFTSGLKSGGVDVATAADLKSIEASAWRQLDNRYITFSGGTVSSETTILFRIDQTAKRLYLQGIILVPTVHVATSIDIDFSSVVKTISPDTARPISYAGDNPFNIYSATVISNKLHVNTTSSGISLIANGSNSKEAPYVTYDELV